MSKRRHITSLSSSKYFEYKLFYQIVQQLSKIKAKVNDFGKSYQVIRPRRGFGKNSETSDQQFGIFFCILYFFIWAQSTIKLNHYSHSLLRVDFKHDFFSKFLTFRSMTSPFIDLLRQVKTHKLHECILRKHFITYHYIIISYVQTGWLTHVPKAISKVCLGRRIAETCNASFLLR